MDTIDCLACLIWLRYYFVLVVNDYSNLNKATPCLGDCLDHNLIIKNKIYCHDWAMMNFYGWFLNHLKNDVHDL
jgi:hypothetical protein